MLEDRHSMSKTVREEVSEHSQEWGYKTGSVYIRKVHFRDAGMISQIEQKVVNRLRQVTSAIQHPAGIDSLGVRLYKARLHFGPGAAKARRAFSFAVRTVRSGRLPRLDRVQVQDDRLGVVRAKPELGHEGMSGQQALAQGFGQRFGSVAAA